MMETVLQLRHTPQILHRYHLIDPDILLHMDQSTLPYILIVIIINNHYSNSYYYLLKYIKIKLFDL